MVSFLSGRKGRGGGSSALSVVMSLFAGVENSRDGSW